MIPLLINTPERMLKIRVITVKNSSSETLRLLQEIGVLHIEQSEELSPADKARLEQNRITVRKTLSGINDILALLTNSHDVPVSEVPQPLSLSDLESEIEDLRSQCFNLRERAEQHETEARATTHLLQYLDPLAEIIDIPLKELQYTGEYLFTNILILSQESYKRFKEKANKYLIKEIATTVKQNIILYFVAKTAHMPFVNSFIEELGVAAPIIPKNETSLKKFITASDKIIQEHQENIETLQGQLQNTIKEKLGRIVSLREILSEENERLSVLDKACEARYVTLIEGWLPERNAETTISILKEKLEYIAVDTKEATSQEVPPTKLQNPRAIKPFEVIVNLFSLPKYGDWDPTPVVAYFFAFFFGLMLCDLVYAAGLLVLARFFLDKLVDDPAAEEVSLFRNVLYISGSIAVIFGIFSGTYLGDFLNMYFGVELQKLALITWVQEKLSDPITFIIISLLIGLVHVNTAHIFALIKGIEEKNKGIIVSKIGLFITEIFGIPYIFKTLLRIDLLPISTTFYPFMAYALVLGLVLIVVSGFMQMGGLGGIFWIFELTGLLGDIMSYSRLAGVGLATFYLASSFNLLANWISSAVISFIPGIIGISLGFIIAIILLVTFHALNLFLSSLAAFIHSLRLCFVEFLLKFYEGGGRKYSPFHLKPKKYVIVGTKS